jgi:hypothetical protein
LYTRTPSPGRPTLNLGGLGGRPPRDIIVLLTVLFVTFTISQFVPVLAVLALTPLLWQRGFLWQIATYPFLGYGSPGLWFLLELLIIYMFGKDVFYQLGRRHFWRLIAWSSISAAVVAVLVQWGLGGLTGLVSQEAPFHLMQGQRILYVILIAAFATMNRQATIYFMFVLPLQAGWFLWIEILIAFMAFLSPPRDLAGFFGICAAVGMTYLYLTRSGLRRGLLRDTRLRLQRWWIQQKMNRMRKKSGLRVIPGGDGIKKGPWSDRIH